jgi:tRNA pseudouridine38-40 synthase
MRSAATAWIGEHDFSAFRAAGCQSHTPWRCVHSIEVHEFADIVAFEITANAFLYHMVRNLVGTLVEIGRRRQPPEWANELLQGRDRKLAAATAPAAGLTLAAIGYPAEYDLPEPQGGLIIV